MNEIKNKSFSKIIEERIVNRIGTGFKAFFILVAFLLLLFVFVVYFLLPFWSALSLYGLGG